MRFRALALGALAAVGLAGSVLVVGGAAHAQDAVLVDCDRVAGTTSIKPGLGPVAQVTSIAYKGPLAGGADPFKPVATTRDCTGILATAGDGGSPDDAGDLIKVSAKLTGSGTCDLLADPPVTDPYDPSDGKLSLTFAGIDPITAKNFSSATYIRVANASDDFLQSDVVDITQGIVTKGVGVGGDVSGRLLVAPFKAKLGPSDQSFLDADGRLVAGPGSTTLGLNCIAGVPTPPDTATTTLTNTFFSTDGTGLLGYDLDSSLRISLPGPA